MEIVGTQSGTADDIMTAGCSSEMIQFLLPEEC